MSATAASGVSIATDASKRKCGLSIAGTAAGVVTSEVTTAFFTGSSFRGGVLNGFCDGDVCCGVGGGGDGGGDGGGGGGEGGGVESCAGCAEVRASSAERR